MIGGCRGDWERKVKRQRSRTHRGNVDAETKAGSDAELIRMQRHISLDGTEVTEKRAPDHVVCSQREVVFSRIEPLEPATDRHAHILRRRTAELKAADRGETT